MLTWGPHRSHVQDYRLGFLKSRIRNVRGCACTPQCRKSPGGFSHLAIRQHYGDTTTDVRHPWWFLRAGPSLDAPLSSNRSYRASSPPSTLPTIHRLSRLNHAASALAVYASQARLPRHHACHSPLPSYRGARPFRFSVFPVWPAGRRSGSRRGAGPAGGRLGTRPPGRPVPA